MFKMFLHMLVQSIVPLPCCVDLKLWYPIEMPCWYPIKILHMWWSIVPLPCWYHLCVSACYGIVIEMPCYHVAMLLAMFWYPTILLFVAMLFSYVNVKFLLYHWSTTDEDFEVTYIMQYTNGGSSEGNVGSEVAGLCNGLFKSEVVRSLCPKMFLIKYFSIQFRLGHQKLCLKGRIRT